jgi:hypothetical protein
MTIRSWIRRLFARPPVSVRPEGSRKAAGARFRSAVESLEDRLSPAVITVLTNGDSAGALTPVGTDLFTAPTLRAAIDGANSLGGSETIRFAAGVFGQTITAALNDTNHPSPSGRRPSSSRRATISPSRATRPSRASPSTVAAATASSASTLGPV